jgi:serine-type D-Ala-D-Ala carboxypeptidase/endopeptidase (penicillin-binding protein 4)
MNSSFIFRVGVLVCFLVAGTFLCKAQEPLNEFYQVVNNWQNKAKLSNTGIGIAIYDTSNGQELMASAPQVSLAPASIFKVVTTATALEVLGPDYRFKTTLFYAGTVRNDTLWGDLQVTGGGDPTLGSMYFEESSDFMNGWLKALINNHIRVVTGRLVVDSSLYEKILAPGTWAWEDLGNFYGAVASGLSVYDNQFEIHLKSPVAVGQPVKILKIKPEIPGLNLQNEVLSSNDNTDQSFVYGNPEDNYRVFRGTIPKGRADFVVKASMPNPPLVLAGEFRSKMASRGMALKGATVFEKAKPGNTVLTETLSPPLREIIRVTNYESVNLFAEHLLKQLAWRKTGVGTTKDGCEFIVSFWGDKGMEKDGFFMADGSGLSRFDGITARQMCFILNYMKTKSAYSDEFVKSLPTAGNGTLSGFNPEYFPNGCLRAKSGSMTRVRCYAGYLTTAGGRQLSFAVMLNNFSCTMKEATHKIEELLVEIRKL